MTSAVLFDLYETLVTESGIRPTRASSLATALGLERDAYRREWKARRPAVVRGQMSFAEALTEISQALSGDVLRIVQPDIAKWGGLTECTAIACNIVKSGKTFCPHYLGGGIGLLA